MHGGPEHEVPRLVLQETILCRGSHHASREWAERTVLVARPLERRGTPAIPSQRFWRTHNGLNWTSSIVQMNFINSLEADVHSLRGLRSPPQVQLVCLGVGRDPGSNVTPSFKILV